MDTLASTSTGAMDQRRRDALKAYREVCSPLFQMLATCQTDVIYSGTENAAARKAV